ncbi:MAG TPA: hypothetical protein VIN02_02490 [Sulfurovum sp.]
MDFIELESLPIGLFDAWSIFEIFLFSSFILLISFEIGYQICKYTSNGNDKPALNSIGPMVSGLLGMLAFVLAFTFAMASSQHTLRKENVLNEANIISTAYLRADLLGERDASKVKALLKEYVDQRINAVNAIKIGDKKTITRMIKRSTEIHDQLWAQLISAQKRDADLIVGLLFQSINDLIDSHQNRVTAGFYNRIPSSIWIVLLTISSLTLMILGAQARISKRRTLGAVIPLIIAFTSLTSLVLDLDRPLDGMITVGQEPMIDLQKTLDQKPSS